MLQYFKDVLLISLTMYMQNVLKFSMKDIVNANALIKCL